MVASMANGMIIKPYEFEIDPHELFSPRWVMNKLTLVYRQSEVTGFSADFDTVGLNRPKLKF